jgi:hypothetical protein
MIADSQGHPEPPEAAAQGPHKRSRFSRARTVLERFVIVPCALLYCAALLVGGMPDEIRPRFLDEPFDLATSFFDELDTKAGLTLFVGDGNVTYRRKDHCWVVVGILPDGSQKVVYETYEGCRYPSVRWFNRDFDTLLSRMFWNEYRALQSPKEKSRKRIVDRLRRSGSMRRVNEYFCEAPFEGNGAYDSMLTVWRYSSVSYRKGKEYPLDAVVHHYSCKTQRSVPHDIWPSVEIQKDQSVHLEGV